MARTLDRTRGFGEIFGGSGSARYEQDGALFDATGKELVAAYAAPAKAKRKSKPADGIEDQVTANLGGVTGD